MGRLKPEDKKFVPVLEEMLALEHGPNIHSGEATLTARLNSLLDARLPDESRRAEVRLLKKGISVRLYHKFAIYPPFRVVKTYNDIAIHYFENQFKK